MFRQPQSELDAIFRDTSGHRYSVMLQLMFAVISFLAMTLFHVMTGFLWIGLGLIFYAIPIKLVLSALSEVVSHSRAKSLHLDGYDDLPPVKSTRKMTFIVFGGAILLVSLMMRAGPSPQGSLGSKSGILIFLFIIGYRVYLAIWRPATRPNLAPSRQKALHNAKSVAANSLKDAALHILMTVLIIAVAAFLFFMWADFGY